jgi:hypothetical protein
MGQGMSDRLAGLSGGNARGALLGAASLAVVGVAVALLITGVTSGEVAATVLFLPVFAAGLLGGRRVGYAAAAVATLAYVGLRRADLAAAGAASAGVLTLTRAGAYLVAGHVGALAQALVPGDAAPAGPRARPGRPVPASDRRRPAGQPAGRRREPSPAWDDPWPPHDREPAPAADRRRVLAGVGSSAGGGGSYVDDGLPPTTMSGGWPPPGPDPWNERDERRGPPDDTAGAEAWTEQETGWHDAPGGPGGQPGRGQAPPWTGEGGTEPAADDSWAAVQESWRRQHGVPPDDPYAAPGADQGWAVEAPPERGPANGRSAGDQWGGPAGRAPDTWAGQVPAADPWGGAAAADDRWGPSGEEAAVRDPWGGGASVDDRWGPPSGQQAAVPADPWGPPATDESWAVPADQAGAWQQQPEPGGWQQPAEPADDGWQQQQEPGGWQQQPEPGWQQQRPEPGGWQPQPEPGWQQQQPEPGDWQQQPDPGGWQQPAEPPGAWQQPGEPQDGGWPQPAEPGAAGTWPDPAPGSGGAWPDPAPGSGPAPEGWDAPGGAAGGWDAPAADPWTSTGQTSAIWDDPAAGHTGEHDQWPGPADPGWAAAGAAGAGAVGAVAGHPAPAPAPQRPEPELPAVDHETGLWTARFLRDRLLAERERSRRSGRPFSLVLVQVPDGPLAQLPYRRQVTLLRELGYQFVAGGVVDHLVHVPDQAQHWFAVILPDTDRSGAQVLERRLRLGIGGYLSSRGLPLRDLESASLTAPDDDPAMGSIWEALIGPDDAGASTPYDR